MIDRSAKSKALGAGGWLNVRLSTLLLLLTAAAVWIAHGQSRRERLLWQDRKQRMELAIGLPKIQDRGQFQVDGLVEDRWFLWVPDSKSCRLRYAFTGLVGTDPPAEYHEAILDAGRHVIELDVWAKPGANYKPPVRLLVDQQEVFSRSMDRRWGIAYRDAELAGQQISPSIHKPLTLARYKGTVRLKSGEAFDLKKHSVGIHLWLSESD